MMIHDATQTPPAGMESVSETEAVRLERRGDGIRVLTFDLPGKSMNVLGRGVMEALDARLEEVAADSDAKGLLIRSAKPGCFIAGADVTEIESIADEPTAAALARFGQDVFGKIEDLEVPSAALIEGACLGGGLELALACDWRLVGTGPGTKLGLPEVKLGLIPGWGGTQRLGRVIGLRKALELTLSGRTIGADEAMKIRLADAAAPLEGAEEWAVAWLAGKTEAGARNPKPMFARGRSWLERTATGRTLLFRGARKNLDKKAGAHYPAPYHALESIANSAKLPLAAGLAREAELLGASLLTPTAQALLKVFDLTQRAKRTRERFAGDSKPVRIDRAGVLGAGFMGSGIAVSLANCGVRVRMKDISNAALCRGLGMARRAFDSAAKRRRISRTEADRRMERLSPTTDMTGFARAEVVIEAVAEDIEIKRRVFREVAEHVPDDCILATNTSSLRVEDIGRDVPHPERVLGLHFFSPAYKMPLVEIVLSEKTSEEAAARAVDLVGQMGKTPLVVRDVPGFLINRILLPYMNEAMYLITEGNDPARIDRAMREFGMPMGPIELADHVGLPIAVHVARILADAYGERMAVAPLIDAIAGLGLKGLFRKAGVIDPAVTSAATDLRERCGAAARPVDEREIVGRLVSVMIAEAARSVDDRVVSAPHDIDLGSIFGIGFPPWREGLLRHADAGENSARAVEIFRELSKRDDGIVVAPRVRYQVPGSLADRAENGKSWYDE